MELNLPNPEILFCCVCTPCLQYICSPNFGFWDVCWPTILWTHGIRLTLVFSHGISPIKEKHCNMVVHGMVWYCTVAL